MAESRIAHSARSRSREERGLDLARERFEEIWRVDRWKWRVPSCSTETVYIVSLKPEFCPCVDFARRGETCKHLFAAWTVKAKTAPCEGCGRRLARWDLIEAPDDHLTFFEGDLLCEECAIGHGVL